MPAAIRESKTDLTLTNENTTTEDETTMANQPPLLKILDTIGPP